MELSVKKTDNFIPLYHHMGDKESSGYHQIGYCGNHRNGDYDVMQNKIRELRKARDITLATLSERTDISEQQLNRLEKGERRLNQDNMRKIAEALHCRPSDLLNNDEKRLVPVLGYVGGGQEIECIDPHMQGQGIEEVEPPTGFYADDIACVAVRGNSMEPMVESNWLLFYRKESDGVPEDCIGQLCVVKLENEGMLVKKIRPGSAPGLYHLLSKNPTYETMFDQKLRWASRVIDIRPR